VHGALREAARVTRPGGRVIVLVPPPVPDRVGGLTLASSYPLRLLGVPTRIWAYHRDIPPPGSGPVSGRAYTTTQRSIGRACIHVG